LNAWGESIHEYIPELVKWVAVGNYFVKPGRKLAL
jgi:hypothetical protein